MRADNAGPATLDRVRRNLVGLRLPRALEVLDHTMQRLERGAVGAVEAIDTLLAEEFTGREGPRGAEPRGSPDKAALRMARLSTVKTLASFDFSFQPSLDRNRILSPAQLAFIERDEVVQIEGSSYRLRQHADLVPETMRAQLTTAATPPKRRGRPPKSEAPDPNRG